MAEIAPQWADQLQGPQGPIWHLGAETDLLNLQCGNELQLEKNEANVFKSPETNYSLFDLPSRKTLNFFLWEYSVLLHYVFNLNLSTFLLPKQ